MSNAHIVSEQVTRQINVGGLKKGLFAVIAKKRDMGNCWFKRKEVGYENESPIVSVNYNSTGLDNENFLSGKNEQFGPSS